MEEFGSGSITDGEFKLEVRITNFSADSKPRSNHDFEKGDKIEILGKMQTNSAYLMIRIDVITTLKNAEKSLQIMKNCFSAANIFGSDIDERCH